MSGNSSIFSCADFAIDTRPFAEGAALPYTVRRDFERFFGADLADVRVHTGDEAGKLGALAFACGPVLDFLPGQYDPETASGQRLLAHELAHVLQQRTGMVRSPFRHLAVIDDPALEREAELAAGLWMEHRALPPGFAQVGAGIPSFGCIQRATPAPARDDQGQQSQWARIMQILGSPQGLAAVGIIGTGALLWYNKDALVTNGVKLGAKAVAGIGSKMFTPRTAANFVLDKFAQSLAKPLTPMENLTIAVKGYASLIIPGGNLMTTALFEGVKVWWNGISTVQSFAMQVYQELPSEWRNEFSTECVKGLAAIAVGQYVENLGAVAETMNAVVTPH